MATVAAVIASTHHPFYYRASTASGSDRPPFADEWVAKIASFRATLTRARPDVLVMVGSDHFHQLWLDNMPQFLVGKAPFYDANFYNEEREFGLPRHAAARPRGPVGVPAAVRPRRRLRPGLQQRAARRSQHHLPDHHAAPPGGPAHRPGLHQHLRPAAAAARPVRPARPGHPRRWSRPGPAISGWPSSAPATCPWSSAARASSARTAPIPSSTARPWSGSPPGTSPARWRRSAWTACGRPGNATHGFMDFMLMMGVAGDGVAADYADSLDLFHTMEAYFTWYPAGADAL